MRKACDEILKEFKTDNNILLTHCLADLKATDPEKRGSAIDRARGGLRGHSGHTVVGVARLE